jgi:hypothetical protein
MDVRIIDYGFSEEFQNYYVTYQVAGLDQKSLGKLKGRLEDPIEVKCDELYLTTYFEEKFYPMGSEDAKKNPDDFIAREEIEMTVYLTDLLED